MIKEGAVQLVFDGSHVGIHGTRVDAFSRLDELTLLFSFDREVRLPGVGAV